MVPLLAEPEVDEAPPSRARLQAVPTVVPHRRPLITPRAGAVLALAGLLAVAVVAASMALGGTDSDPAPTGVAAGPAEHGAVSTVTYVPGQSSSWHRHPGLHAVTVLSGTLTVYGPDCEAQTFGPGQSYVGGHQTHLAVNATDAPLEMAVIYTFDEGSSMANFLIPASPPAGCTVA